MLILVAEMADSSEIVPVYDPMWPLSQVTDLYTQMGQHFKSEYQKQP